MLSNGFTNNDALIALLTVESLVFAALAVAVSFSIPGNRVPDLPAPAWVIGHLAAGFVSVVAFGGLMAWWSIFAVCWPNGFRGAAIGVTLGLAIVGQPVFAWIFARGLRAQQ
jgi:hypothetical protein